MGPLTPLWLKKKSSLSLHFDPNPIGGEKVQVKINFSDLNDEEATNSRYFKIETSFKKYDIDSYQNSLGLHLMGPLSLAKIMVSKLCIQHQNEWLACGCCVVHRLELARKKSVSGSAFDDTYKLILQMYYICNKSPKKIETIKTALWKARVCGKWLLSWKNFRYFTESVVSLNISKLWWRSLLKITNLLLLV